MPEDPPISLRQQCFNAHKARTDAAWIVYQASGKTLADEVAYLNELAAALAALNTCLENCPTQDP